MCASRVEPLDDGVLRSVADVLGETNNGLSNKQIDELLRATKIVDPNPRNAGFGVAVMRNKRDRLYQALAAAQHQSGAGNVVVRFIRAAMQPARYLSSPEVFEDRRHCLNEVLSFSGLHLRKDGVMQRGASATTLTEARQRAQRLHGILRERAVHPRLRAACVDEIRDDNYFHAVFEAAKSLAEELRRRSGSRKDGWDLVTEALQVTKANPVPPLALNSLQTETEISRQRGLENGIRAIFSAARNPTAHEPKILSSMSEQDAVDLLTQMSYLHRQLDQCVETPAVSVRDA